MKQCPNCKKLKIGELQSVCKNCGHTDGNDRWFSNEESGKSIRPVSDF